MVKGVNEKDWKLFRSRLPVWQETYMEKIIEEYRDSFLQKTPSRHSVISNCPNLISNDPLRVPPVTVILSLSGPDRMADHRFQFLRRGFPDVAQIDLMVQALIRDVRHIPLLLQIPVHLFHRGRFVIIGPDMHALDAQAFIPGQELRF